MRFRCSFLQLSKVQQKWFLLSFKPPSSSCVIKIVSLQEAASLKLFCANSLHKVKLRYVKFTNTYTDTNTQASHTIHLFKEYIYTYTYTQVHSFAWKLYSRNASVVTSKETIGFLISFAYKNHLVYVTGCTKLSVRTLFSLWYYLLSLFMVNHATSTLLLVGKD